MSFLAKMQKKYVEGRAATEKDAISFKFSTKAAANFTWEDLGDNYWYSESQLAGDYTYRGEIQLFDGKYEWKIENADSGRLIDSGEADEVDEAKLEVEQRVIYLQQAYQDKKKKKPPFKSESLNELYFEIKDGIASDNDDIAPASSYFEKIRKVKPNTS